MVSDYVLCVRHFECIDMTGEVMTGEAGRFAPWPCCFASYVVRSTGVVGFA